MPLDILYEDEDLLVINKAPGVVVHPGAGHFEGTLVHGLLAHCPQLASQGAPLRPGIVHRLDQDTSGALVVAKSSAAYLDLIKQFKDHTVEKHYLALVYGSFSQTGGQLTTSLGRHPVDRKKIAVQQGKGLLAVTRWRVEKAWQRGYAAAGDHSNRSNASDPGASQLPEASRGRRCNLWRRKTSGSIAEIGEAADHPGRGGSATAPCPSSRLPAPENQPAAPL